MKIKRYSINLSEQMAACDGNYIRILKLLPDLSAGRVREIAIPGAESVPHIVFVIEVLERFKYTSTLRISQRRPGAARDIYQPPEMLVRIYHDANTAEVVAYQNHRHFNAGYPAPNSQMYQADEKDQLNRFLTDWLNLCLQKGVCNDEMSELLTYAEP